MAGVGFDAQVVADLNLVLKRRVGKLAYAYQIACQLLRNPTHRCRATCDGVEYEAASAIVMKGRFYGGSFVLAPDSRIDEPFFHLVLFRDGGRAAALRYLTALAFRRVHRRPDVRILRTSAVSLTLADGAAVQIDGDIAGQMPLAFSIAAAPLQLIYPA
jgi:diacylglycerol kinase family enzyme